MILGQLIRTSVSAKSLNFNFHSSKPNKNSKSDVNKINARALKSMLSSSNKWITGVEKEKERLICFH